MCKREIPLTNENFRPRKDSKDGFRNECISCGLSQKKQYRELNSLKIKEVNRRYRENNPEKDKLYREKNKEKIAKYYRKYQKNNAIKYRIFAQKRVASKKQLIATLTTQQWESVKVKFNNKCAYCGQEKPLSQEHFISVINNGEYTHNNIIPSCKSCNSSKGAKDFFEWYSKYKYYSKKREKLILKYLRYNKERCQQLKLV